MFDLFTYAPSAPLTEADEVALIAAAQAGDEAATLRLLEAYGPALRSAVASFKGGIFDGQVSAGSNDYGTSSFALEDARQAAVVGALAAIAEHDPALNPRLAGRLGLRVARELADEAATRSAFQIPDRTLSRFFGIMREAEGDFEVGLEIAAEKGMSPDTFRAVYVATGAETLPSHEDEEGGSGTRPRPASPVFAESPVVDLEDRMLVDLAFKAIDDEEARIVELAYGFTEYDPVPDAEIGHRVGLTRPTVQRKRVKALSKMRKTLGASA